ncbi:hypothetical protein SS50377_24715 [Spironucleus salmonicida]|nr:hypothetical protein SS50377_24715 [Spironucleus salmonicida]
MLSSKLNSFNKNQTNKDLGSHLTDTFQPVISYSPQKAQHEQIKMLQNQLQNSIQDQTSLKNQVMSLTNELQYVQNQFNKSKEENLTLQEKLFSLENPIVQRVKGADFDYKLDLYKAVEMINKVKSELIVLKDLANNILEVPGIQILQGQVLASNETFQNAIDEAIQQVNDKFCSKKCQKCNKVHGSSTLLTTEVSYDNRCVTQNNKSCTTSPFMQKYERSYVEQKVCNEDIVNNLLNQSKLCDAPILKLGKCNDILTPRTLDQKDYK